MRSHQITTLWLRQTDLEDVLAVEKATFAKTQGKANDLLEWIEEPTNFGIVAEKHNRVVGYLLATGSRKKPLVKIINATVHPHRRSQGAATQLLDQLFRLFLSELGKFNRCEGALQADVPRAESSRPAPRPPAAAAPEAFPQPSLAPPVRRRGDRQQVVQDDRVRPALNARQEQDLLLNVRGQQ
jgi:hypothetical protein